MYSNLSEAALADPRIREVLENPTIGHQDAARQIAGLDADFTESSVRRWRKARKSADSEGYEVVNSTATLDLDNEGATINNVVVNAQILDDWGPVFELFNLNAAHFEVVDDTVKMSTWQQSKGADDGTRDSIQLYSYSARFRRVNKDMIPVAKVTEWRKELLNQRWERDWEPQTKWDLPTTYNTLVADPQLGKKGTEEAVENWKRGVLAHVDQIKFTTPSSVHIAFMGDETENCMGNYANQPATIELNRSQQLELDFDMRVWTLRQFASLGLPLTVSSVISNHGEWTRWGMSKEVVTSRNDNASTYIARQVKKLFDELEPFGGPQIHWYIGDDTPGVTVNLSGVDVYFSHGYVEKGRGSTTEAKMQNAIERQILGDTDRHGKTPLWFMAHYHHFYSNEFQDRTLFGVPALEALKSSEYMRDQYGVWSQPGMLGLLVGNHTDRKFSDINIF